MNETKLIRKNFKGYFFPTDAIALSITSIFAAIACVLTMTVSIPVPATGGYINIGELAVMLSGLIFGPIIGFLSGGVGSALADIFLGYPNWAFWTFLVKGLEGFLVGLIANPRIFHGKRTYKDIIGVIAGGSLMVFGYFIVELFVFNFGIVASLSEVPGNFFQFIFGAIGSILLIVILRISILNSNPQTFERIFVIEDKRDQP
jgi:uncharacterized membrane protein